MLEAVQRGDDDRDMRRKERERDEMLDTYLFASLQGQLLRLLQWWFIDAIVGTIPEKL